MIRKEDLMLEKEIYANGQKVYDLKDDYLTYYFKNGALKAEGHFIKNKKEAEWVFYRKTGYMWKKGTYIKGKRDGQWQRFSADGQVESDCIYRDGELSKA
jgi:antitoxin component YwqK of YwqJK toxin-antitoxin module